MSDAPKPDAPAPDAPGPEDALIPDLDLLPVPTEFPAGRFKLGLIAALEAGVAVVLLRAWSDSGESTALVGAAGFGLAAALFAKEAADPRPLILISEQGIEDRRHGFIPWADVAWWEGKSSILATYFGYSLRKGAVPPRNGWMLKVQGAMLALSGRPQRIWYKKMLPLGVEPMAASFRRFAPQLEKAAQGGKK